jgi:hypothetical protein
MEPIRSLSDRFKAPRKFLELSGIKNLIIIITVMTTATS